MNAEKKKVVAIVLAVICVIGCVAGAYAAGYYRGFNSRTTTLKANDKKDLQGMSEDDIEPLKEDTISVLLCGIDNTQKLTDVIMYARFDTKAKSVNVLRIPRDTFVGSAFPTGKANAIYGHPYTGMDGIETLKKYLEDNWKLDIDYYATIDLASVRDIIDDMGGVTMDIQQEINYLPGKVLHPGVQTLNGDQAEWILRYRAGYANGDLGRIDAQTQFLYSCIDRVHELGRVKCIPIVMKHYNDVDTDMPLNKMLSVATSLFELNAEDMKMHVVPGKGTMYYSYAVYAVDKTSLVDILNENFVTKGKTLTVDDIDLPDIYGGNSGSSNGQNNYNRYNNNNNNYNQYNNSQNGGTTQNTQEGAEEFKAQYQYDQNGNPLYRLDENGNPIYDYDEDGNILYVYQQAGQENKTESQQKPGNDSEKSAEKVTETQNGSDNNKDDKSDKNTESSGKKPKKKEDDRKVILSKSNQEKKQNEQEEESSNENRSKYSDQDN